MLIVGAKGFAKEVLEVLNQLNQIENLVFYDDVNMDQPDILYDTFQIINSILKAEYYFRNIDNRFTIGVGNPFIRKKLHDKFVKIGGKFTSTISNKAFISSFNVSIGKGCNILPGAVFSNDVSIGDGCIIYYNSIITHDCAIGNFVEISPSVTILGRCKIGDFCQIGANSTILPDVVIGENVIIGAGSVVTKNIPDNCLAFGVPAVLKKK